MERTHARAAKSRMGYRSPAYHDHVEVQRSGRGASIAIVAETLGIPVPTIRSWERRYGFPSPSRTRGAHRRYTEREIEQLRELRDLITKGLAPREAVRALAGARDRPGDPAYARALVRAALALDRDAFETALDQAAERLGLEEAIRSVVLPSMRELGTRWKAGTCDVAHEHLATDLVRRWLAAKAAPLRPRSRRDPVVLACGPNDLHTIGLEAFDLMLALRGCSTRLLGASTPTASIVSAVRTLRSPAAVVTAQRAVTRAGAFASIQALAAIPGVRVFYAGEAFAIASRRLGVPGTYLGDDVVRAAETIAAAVAPRTTPVHG